MVKLKKRLGQILVTAGLITESQLQEAMESLDGRTLSRTLVTLGYAKEADIASAVAKSMNLPYVDLTKYEVNASAVTLVSEELARRYLILPIDIEGEKLIVAMADPANIFAIDDLRIITGYDIKPVVCTETDINAAIGQHVKMDSSVEEMMESAVEEDKEVEAADRLVAIAEEAEAGEEAPIVKLVNVMITEAARSRAADIHIEPQENDVRVRYRIDGVLHEVMRSPKKVQTGMLTRLKIMANLDIAERRVPQDGRFSLIVDKKPVDFRVASLPTIHGEKIVLRLLEKESILMSLDDLGFLPDSLERYNHSLSKPYGAILICGPTGCGKTTTLYTGLNIVNSPEKNLITVEDPVEYRLTGVNQVQVNVKAGLTFGAALRSILRHDPDIVMIGEIRDPETALIAIESALTGHLVLSTLHTNDAPAAITRLTEMGVEPFLSSSAIDLVICQRLARKLCPNCKEPYAPSLEVINRLEITLEGSNEVPTLYKAKGCENCNQTGYKGRIGVFEVLVMSETIERLTVERATTDEIKRQAVSEGMKTLRDDGMQKAIMGITSVEEVMRVVI